MNRPPQAVNELASALLRKKTNRRMMVALVGAPGSGKSRLAEFLKTAFRVQGASAEILPMDGFHYDDSVLKERGRLAYKGAPDTFDVAGLRSLLMRLKAREEDVAVPVFDRALEISRAAARVISAEVEVVIVEGNYLLSTQPPWSELAACFDATLMLEVSEDILHQRLCERWRGYGLEETEVLRKVETNDLPNGHYVMQTLSLVDYRLDTSYQRVE